MNGLAGWSESSFTADGKTLPVFRQGTGPGVVIVHEIPGITPTVQQFAQDVVDSGFTVVMPSLFGTPGDPMNVWTVAKSVARVCISSEFANLALNTTSPITTWLRALAADLHAELGGPGVGALGMCATGGFALAMMVDPSVVAPVLSQPSMPFAVTPARGRDLNLSPADLDSVKARVAAGCPVLGLRYSGDPAVGGRFDTLRRELGDGFVAVELPGRKHGVLTEDRDEPSVQRVLEFFHDRLDG
ncbi:dienelactone hydrolase family protein [Nocardioides marmorisolisilvae]|uniref:dienelactone hydrolase family protein n=1 Tax=Nocardioides marmorisolisilvae TaxID=1542737 RepID=UPI001FE6CDDF|nr:dienelactone hydrolase family protein [Nocardioides marmorisolisilvae]